MESITEITVRYAETDMMGIAHHSRYYPWFEIARGDFVKAVGLTYKQMEEDGVLLPLVETHARYFIPLRYDEKVRVVTHMTKLNAASCEFSYEIYKDDTLCTRGRTVHAITGRDLKPFNLKKANPSMWEKLSTLVENVPRKKSAAAE